MSTKIPPSLGNPSDAVTKSITNLKQNQQAGVYSLSYFTNAIRGGTYFEIKDGIYPTARNLPTSNTVTGKVMNGDRFVPTKD